MHKFREFQINFKKQIKENCNVGVLAHPTKTLTAINLPKEWNELEWNSGSHLLQMRSHECMKGQMRELEMHLWVGLGKTEGR